MPDERHDIRQTLAAAGLDLAVIHAATMGTMRHEERAVALVRAFGALRQRDLVQLMAVSSASISRLVTSLLAAERVREQVFKDGAVGRPTNWLLAADGDPPSYQQRQAIIACLPDVIAYLHTTPLSASVYAAIEEPPISLADPPVHAAPNVPPVSREEPSGQMALTLWWGTGEDLGAHAETRAATLASNERPPIAAPVDRFAPPLATVYVAPPVRSLRPSPIPPWERSRFRRCRWPRGHALVQRGAAGVARGMGQLLRLMLRLLILGGRLLWGGLRLLGIGIQKQVWLIDDLNDRVVGWRWLLLGVAVAVVVSLLVGLRRQSVGITIPVASPPAEMTPTALATAIPLQIGRAQVIGTGKDGLIVRDAPGGKRIGKLASGVLVVILGGPRTIANQEHTLWWKVQYGDMVGWVSATFLSRVEPTP
jgi:hypothetical protein